MDLDKQNSKEREVKAKLNTKLFNSTLILLAYAYLVGTVSSSFTIGST